MAFYNAEPYVVVGGPDANAGAGRCRAGRLEDVRFENIVKTDGNDASEAKAKKKSSSHERKVVSLATADFGKPVLCVPGLGRLDECAVLIVADALRREGINARVTGAQTGIENDEASSICLCYIENVSKARLDYAVRKLSKKSPAARIVVCLLSDIEPTEASSASHQQRDQSHSLRATIAVLTNFQNRAGTVVGN